MGNVFPDLFGAQWIGWAVEVFCKFLDAPQVDVGRACGIVSPHNFFGHHLT
jgi:hypothetical protein